MKARRQRELGCFKRMESYLILAHIILNNDHPASFLCVQNEAAVGSCVIMELCFDS